MTGNKKQEDIGYLKVRVNQLGLMTVQLPKTTALVPVSPGPTLTYPQSIQVIYFSNDNHILDTTSKFRMVNYLL